MTGNTYRLMDCNRVQVAFWSGIIDVDAVSNANIAILYGKSGPDSNKAMEVVAVVHLPAGFYIEKQA